MFRVMSVEELRKLTREEHIDYTRRLIEHVNGVIATVDASIRARDKKIKKPAS